MNFAQERFQLVEDLRDRGIVDERVLAAIGRTPRERFVGADARNSAYADRALGIESGQTISQPYMVALMSQELGLQGPELVLEIGTGSGYQAAILAQLCRHVVTIERLAELSESARGVLSTLGLDNVEFHVGDGTLGYAEGGPYDGVIVTAAAPTVPKELYRQLKPGGRLVIPVGTSSVQHLRVFTKTEKGPLRRDVCDCCFVKLIGQEGWPDK